MKKKATTFMTPTGALIYVQLEENNLITDFIPDAKFDLYCHIRKNIPGLCKLFDTRRDLKKELAKQNYYI